MAWFGTAAAGAGSAAGTGAAAGGAAAGAGAATGAAAAGAGSAAGAAGIGSSVGASTAASSALGSGATGATAAQAGGKVAATGAQKGASMAGQTLTPKTPGKSKEGISGMFAELQEFQSQFQNPQTGGLDITALFSDTRRKDLQTMRQLQEMRGESGQGNAEQLLMLLGQLGGIQQ